jgi:uncharacterized protein (TIGR04562 family)
LMALRVVKYLKDKMIIMPPNIKPSRSRNTLIQLDYFRTQLGDILGRFEQRGSQKEFQNGFQKEFREFKELDKEFNEEELISKLETAAHPPSGNSENPHSSEFYRSIQFTCRQLIKFRNPIYDELKELKVAAKNQPWVEGKSGRGVDSATLPAGAPPRAEGQGFPQLDEQPGAKTDTLLKLIEKIELKHIQREIRFFYPFEVQVVDKKSSEENEKGKSAHSEYKKAQVLTAMKRVMGSLVDAVR